MDEEEKNLDQGKLDQEGPRLDRNRGHFSKCHARWVEKMTRPGGSTDYNEDWYAQQCGGCRFYIHLTGQFKSDWGVCSNEKSPRDGRATFEHDGCDAFVACDAGWS